MTFGASITKAAHTVNRVALGLARQWWRPASCLSIAGSILVSGVYLPIRNKTGADLASLAALVASLTPFIAARSFEKTRGAAGDQNG